jgi:hypothetical protein
VILFRLTPGQFLLGSWGALIQAATWGGHSGSLSGTVPSG